MFCNNNSNNHNNNSQYNKRVVIFSPICNRQFILPYYLKHLSKITYPNHLISFYFLVNNSTDQSLSILKQFKKNNPQYENIKIEIFDSPKPKSDKRTQYTRESFTYPWLALLRNKGISYCINNNYDYMFSCDSDILVKSSIIEDLMNNNKPYVASLLYNGYKYVPDDANENYDPIVNAYKYTNILKKYDYGYKHIVNVKTKNPNLNPKGTLIETDFTGACFLASRDICKHMAYASHPKGEDLPASISAIKAGFTLYCDASVYSQHCMDQNILDLYLQGKLMYNNGEVIKI